MYLGNIFRQGSNESSLIWKNENIMWIHSFIV